MSQVRSGRGDRKATGTIPTVGVFIRSPLKIQSTGSTQEMASKAVGTHSGSSNNDDQIRVLTRPLHEGIGSCPVNSINGAFVIEKSTPPDAVSAGIGSRPVSSINGTLNKDALPEMSVEERLLSGQKAGVDSTGVTVLRGQKAGVDSTGVTTQQVSQYYTERSEGGWRLNRCHSITLRGQKAGVDSTGVTVLRVQKAGVDSTGVTVLRGQKACVDSTGVTVLHLRGQKAVVDSTGVTVLH
ncbi:hypothetical protein DPMN_041215 [Dreissena polymorpha]|uniref:Uncharacterized protein n=1 Tax=Dreissena polymorpha TaxID=45954 RepID=A0A9D4HW06_DREPO|nr:hypothetical protein DPMN_041215 [Dreissena polymorpha]